MDDKNLLMEALQASDYAAASALAKRFPCSLLIANWDRNSTIRENARNVVEKAADPFLGKARNAAVTLRNFELKWEGASANSTFLNFMLPNLGIGALTCKMCISPHNKGFECQTILQCMPFLHDSVSEVLPSLENAREWGLDCWCAYASVLEFGRLRGGFDKVATMGGSILVSMTGSNPLGDLCLACLVNSIDEKKAAK